MFTPYLLALAMISHQPQPQAAAAPVVLSTHKISLEERYKNEFVNGVFKDNILLTLRYMDGSVTNRDQINWEAIQKPFHYEFSLNPNEGFAFHDKSVPQYSGSIVKTTGVHFNSQEGFRYDGDLTGDGVCHLASLLYWIAKDAALETYAPSNHNFAPIPEVPKEYGVAILSPNPLGNLYIVNNKEDTITLSFDYDGVNLSATLTQS